MQASLQNSAIVREIESKMGPFDLLDCTESEPKVRQTLGGVSNLKIIQVNYSPEKRKKFIEYDSILKLFRKSINFTIFSDSFLPINGSDKKYLLSEDICNYVYRIYLRRSE